MDAGEERFLKECCGSIHYILTKYGGRDVPFYLQDQLNRHFRFEDQGYGVAIEGIKMKLENEKITIDFINDLECDKRVVNLQFNH